VWFRFENVQGHKVQGYVQLRILLMKSPPNDLILDNLMPFAI